MGREEQSRHEDFYRKSTRKIESLDPTEAETKEYADLAPDQEETRKLSMAQESKEKEQKLQSRLAKFEVADAVGEPQVPRKVASFEEFSEMANKQGDTVQIVSEKDLTVAEALQDKDSRDKPELFTKSAETRTVFHEGKAISSQKEIFSRDKKKPPKVEETQYIYGDNGKLKQENVTMTDGDKKTEWVKMHVAVDGGKSEGVLWFQMSPEEYRRQRVQSGEKNDKPVPEQREELRFDGEGRIMKKETRKFLSKQHMGIETEEYAYDSKGNPETVVKNGFDGSRTTATYENKY